MAGSPESIETKYEQIRRFLSVGEIPSTYNKSKRFNFKQYCAKFTLKDGEIYCDQRQVVKSEEEALIHFGEVHTLPIGGHAGFNKTCSALSSKWFWHGMTQDIRKWIQECDKCQKVVRLQTAPQQLQCIKAKKTPRKAKCKSKKCVLCRKKLDPNYLSSHCEACVKRIVEDVSPSFSKSMQEVVRAEIKACMSTWSSVQPEPSYSTIAIHSSVPGFTEERDFFELEEGDLDEESEILVEACPVIWDKSLEANKDRVAKEEAWTEVFHNLFQDWDSKTAREQGAIEMQVTKRWCSVRDAFHKHQQKQARSGSGGDTGSTYKYYNQLLFLLPSQELSGTSSNVDFQSEDEVVEGANSTPEEPNITTTDDPQASGDDEEVDIPISQAASEQPIETSQDVERVEDSDVPRSSGVQPSRLTPPDPRRITLPSRRATARAALRRRLRPEHDFIEEIIALIHRQRSEDRPGYC